MLLAVASILLQACSTLPSAGPRKGQVSNEYEDDQQARQFELIDVSPAVVQILKQRDGASFAETYGVEAPPPKLVVRKGDALSITLWEAGAQPLFSSATSLTESGGARAAVLPQQTVGTDGSISIPFSGRVRVEGLSLSEIESAVRTALRGKAARPQALVTKVSSSGDSVTVIGEFVNGGVFPLTSRGERLLDILAAAGGVKAPAYETIVGLTRDGQTTRVPLTQLLAQPRENVFVYPGDILSISRKSNSYTVFGATATNAQIKFEDDEINLVEAVAKAGGLNDHRADPRGVYLLRSESTAIASSLSGGQNVPSVNGHTPVVYRLDLTQVNSYFLGRQIAMRDGDVLYVANAPATTMQKLFQLIGLVTQPVLQGVVLDSATN